MYFCAKAPGRAATGEIITNALLNTPGGEAAVSAGIHYPLPFD